MLFPVLLALLAGGAAGYASNVVMAKRRGQAASDQAKKILDDAQAKAKEATLEAKAESLRLAEAAKRDEKERRLALNQTEQQLLQRQGSLDQKLEELDRRGEKLRKHEAELDTLKDDLRAIRTKQQQN